MKSIIYLLTILSLSLLISCSEEPPTNSESETLTKKPIKDPPPNRDPLNLDAGDVHIVGVTTEIIRNKSRSSFRVWTYPYTADPQIRELEGTLPKVAIYDNNGAVELLVYNYYTTGKNRNRLEHYELQIWRDDVDPETYNLDGFLYLDIAIGELDSRYDGDEIVLGGFNMGSGPEIRIYNPNYYPGDDDFAKDRITTYESTYGPFGRPVIIGDVAGDGTNEIIFDPTRRGLVVLDYDLGEMEVLGTYTTPDNEQMNAIAVAYVEGNGNDEIIWGGNGGRIHILEFDGTAFTEKWYSENLGSSIHNLAAGEFDGDLGYEFAVSSGNPSIFVFDYYENPSNPENWEYTRTTIEPPINEGVVSMFAGNANNDPSERKDLVVGTRTSVKAYDGLSGYTSINIDVGTVVSEIYVK